MTRVIPHNLETVFRFRVNVYVQRLAGGPVICRQHPGNTVGVQRPGYTTAEAQQVADWLNGNDRPVTMVPPEWDCMHPAFRPFPTKA